MAGEGDLLGPLFGTPAARAALSDRARLQAMLDVEAALARAEAKTGVIPAEAVAPIEAACRAELYDLAALGQAVITAGVPTIPMVKQLTAEVRKADPDAARFVHWGATSQDIFDTGTVLMLRAALGPLDADLGRLAAALAGLAERHATTPMPGRTWLQHAVPVSFGLKAAGWLGGVVRGRARLRDAAREAFVLQFGGASGTLASLKDRGPDVAAALASELGLSLPEMPWHAQRDRMGALAAALGLLAGSLGKIGRDVALLMQTDVQEAFEPAAEGKGGSSTMPHKRNPVGASVVLAAATRAPGLVATMLAAMPQEHERGLGLWPAEWDTLPELVLLVSASAASLAESCAGLEVDAARMRQNLDSTQGLVFGEAVMMALGGKLGRLKAHEILEGASKRAVSEGRHLREVLAEDPEVSAELDGAALEALFRPEAELGATEVFVAEALAAWRAFDDRTSPFARR